MGRNEAKKMGNNLFRTVAEILGILDSFLDQVWTELWSLKLNQERAEMMLVVAGLFGVASRETYGTLGAIVKSRTGNRQVGFLTNRHVAVDLDYPSQKMFHPLPPSLGPGVYLGAVERMTSFIADDLWYCTFAGTNPEKISDIQWSLMIERHKLWNLLYSNDRKICCCQRSVKRNQIRVSTPNQGRLILKVGKPPENWTRGVDLGCVLDLLELDLITNPEGL